MTIETAYENHRRQIKKQVGNYVRKFGSDFEETEAIANLIFVEAFNEYSSLSLGGRLQKYKFSGILHNKIEWGLIGNHRKLKKERVLYVDDANRLRTDFKNCNVVDQITFWDKVRDLTSEAKEVFKVIFVDSPTEFFEFAESRKKVDKRLSQGVIAKHLQKEKGWSKYQCRRAFNEIKFKFDF